MDVHDDFVRVDSDECCICFEEDERGCDVEGCNIRVCNGCWDECGGCPMREHHPDVLPRCKNGTHYDPAPAGGRIQVGDRVRYDGDEDENVLEGYIGTVDESFGDQGYAIKWDRVNELVQHLPPVLTKVIAKSQSTKPVYVNDRREVWCERCFLADPSLKRKITVDTRVKYTGNTGLDQCPNLEPGFVGTVTDVSDPQRVTVKWDRARLRSHLRGDVEALSTRQRRLLTSSVLQRLVKSEAAFADAELQRND